MTINPRLGLEADPAQLALVLAVGPERGPPLSERFDVKPNGSGGAADRQVDLALERGRAGAVGEAALERDLRVVFVVEEVRARRVCVAVWLAGPDAGCVDLSFERRSNAVVPVELDPAMDV